MYFSGWWDNSTRAIILAKLRNAADINSNSAVRKPPRSRSSVPQGEGASSDAGYLGLETNRRSWMESRYRKGRHSSGIHAAKAASTAHLAR